MTLRLLISRLLNEPRSWLRATLHREQLENEMNAELEDHLEHLTADLIRAGHSPAGAARRARVALGPALANKENMRASLGLRWWDELRGDVRFGVRMLRKNLGFTAIACLSLALAIGANTTIFAVGKQLLYARLHVPHPDQLELFRWSGGKNNPMHHIWGDFQRSDNGETITSSFSYPAYLQLRAHNEVLQDLFAFKEDSMNATIAGTAQRYAVSLVSGNFYQALGVQTQLGRPIQASDDGAPGTGEVAVISDGLWQRAFNRSPAVLGQTIRLNQAVMTIVGVNPRGFTGAKNVLASPDIFVPMSMMPVLDVMPAKSKPILEDSGFWWMNVMGRLKPGVSVETARAALDVQLSSFVRSTFPITRDTTMPRLVLADGSRGMRWGDRMFRKPISVLGVFTAFVLLLACANVANLMLARGAQRQREMSVRLALGAGRIRILRQLLTESLLLAALGGAGGLLLGYLGRNVLPNLLNNAWDDQPLTVSFDWIAFAFTAIITALTGVLFGLAPAWFAARAEVAASLKSASSTTTRRRRGLGGKAIVGFQIALSTLLVVGAGLFLHSLLSLDSVDTGFRTDRLLLAEVNPPAARYPAAKAIEVHKLVEQRIAAIPGVEHVSAASVPYLAQTMDNSEFHMEDKAEAAKNDSVDYNIVGNDFFQTLGIPIVAGRPFGPQDTGTSQKVAIVNQTLARTRFAGQSPVGKRFRTGDKDPWITIVGVCADTRYDSIRDASPEQFLLPYVQQEELRGMTYEIRSSFSPEAIMRSLRQVMQSIDRDLPVVDVRTERQQIDATNSIDRAFAALTAGYGLLALGLACVGIYGVMAYSVANRQNEIGIRLALGALPAQVRSMVLRESAWIAVAGIVAGLSAAFALVRLIKSMLYGIGPYDPVSLGVAVALLLGLALAASWIPARRAAAIEPMQALRHD